MRMLYPQVDAEVWAKRYGLTIRHVVCHKCGFTARTDIPYAHDRVRGLHTGLHGCGILTAASVSMELPPRVDKKPTKKPRKPHKFGK